MSEKKSKTNPKGPVKLSERAAQILHDKYGRGLGLESRQTKALAEALDEFQAELLAKLTSLEKRVEALEGRGGRIK
jgi:hypothetical protein